jgi:hypothetical protein
MKASMINDSVVEKPVWYRPRPSSEKKVKINLPGKQREGKELCRHVSGTAKSLAKFCYTYLLEWKPL